MIYAGKFHSKIVEMWVKREKNSTGISFIYISYDDMKKPIKIDRGCTKQINVCFETTRSLGWNGYPRIKLNGRNVRLNRLVYCLYNQKSFEDIKGKLILHACDNRLCCNPEHLSLGTAQDNTFDMIARDRAPQIMPSGYKNLHEYQVIIIKQSDLPAKELAEIYCTDEKTVRYIKNKLEAENRK